jgi:hypothetical protein
MKHKGLIPLMLPALVALILLAWAIWVTMTAFVQGALPVAGWETDRKYLFGTIWVIGFLTILLPIYFFGISLGLTAFLENPEEAKSRPPACWRVAWGMTIVMVLITFCTRLATTSWFETPMHPPFQAIQGGLKPGLLSTLVLITLLTIFYRLMRKLTH